LISPQDLASLSPAERVKVQALLASNGQYQQNYWLDAGGAPHYLVRFLTATKASPGFEAGTYSQGEAADFQTALQLAAGGL
jgi:hypothetical protein